MRWIVLALIAVGKVAPVAAQAPTTDIFLVPLRHQGDRLVLGDLRNLTNRAGYDNQPFFAPDGKSIYYTSVRPGGPAGSTQADIFQLELASNRTTPITRTPESEYSAVVMPGGRELAVVRVELDSTQRLWAFPLNGGAPRRLLEDVKPVGYHAWIDSNTVATFVLGSPPTLQIAELRSGRARTVLTGIGRALQPVRARPTVTVTQQRPDSSWWIVEVGASGPAKDIVRIASGDDFFAWMPDGALLTARGNTVLRFRPGRDADWVVVGELAAPGVGRISRIAVSPDGAWLAVVAAEQNP